MMNIRKGLAVVLAAATAFTFVPVAGTIAPVVAEAAQTEVVTYDANGQTQTARTGDSKNNTPIEIDTVAHKSEQIHVDKASQLPAYLSDKNSVASVSNGLVTAVASGSAIITVNVGDNNYYIPVNVSSIGHDKVSAVVDGEKKTSVDLDLSTSIASNAKKSAKITATSETGLPVKYDLYSEDQKTLIAGNKNTVASVSSDGTVLAGTSAGTVYVKSYTTDDNGRNIKGAETWTKVTVNAKPLVAVSAPASIRLDVASHKTVDLTKYITSNVTDVKPVYTVAPATGTENDGVASVTGNTLTALKTGDTTLTVAFPEGKTTRATTATVRVNVTDRIEKNSSDLHADTYLSLTTGSTAKINAVTTASPAAITYTSANTATATVDLNGVVTGISKGITVVTVSSKETDDMLAGTATVTIVVNDPAQVQPAKVKDLKVTRKKNATKVSVKWTAQTGTGIYYRVEKTTVKKVGGKTVKTKAYKYVKNGKASTNLKIGRNDTIKVRVRAIVDNQAGNKVAASWSKAVTSKPKK